MKTLAFSLLILLSTLPAFNQDIPIKFGKISQEEIELTKYENADAVILCDYGTMQLDGKTKSLYMYRFRHLRIKILTENGLKHVKQSIPFYDLVASSDHRSNRTYELKAQTINIDGNGNLIKTRVKAKAEQVGKPDQDYMNLLEFKFPDVKVGSIIEYEINIPTIEIVNPDAWYFQQNIPVIHSEMQIICPENINYRVKTYNTELDVAETTHNSVLVGYQSGSSTFPGYQIRLVKKNVPAANIDMPDHERMYAKFILDFASLEPYIPGMQYLFRATDPNFKYKDRPGKRLTLTKRSYILYRPPDLATLPKKILKDPEYGPPAGLPSEIGDTIKALTAGCKDKNEEIEVIYAFISNYMTWNGAYRISVDPMKRRSLSKPYKKQEGTNSEINYMLISAFRRVGIDANPVFVTTFDNGRLDPEFFNLHQFNHILALVEINGEERLFDAVLNENGISKLKNGEIYPVGLVIKNKEAYWITIDE